MTTTPQTEASRLADAIDPGEEGSKVILTIDASHAAAELRRLDAENKRLQQAHDIACEIGAQYAAERDQLRAQVEALSDSVAAKADRIDRLGEMVERLLFGMQQALSKLTTLLDEDQFAHIESIMTIAGVTPPDVERLHGGEPAVRFCPGCGSVGAVPDTYKDCCPDGNHARMIPESLARRCNDLFYLALNAAQSASQEPVTLTDDVAENAARYVWLRDFHIGDNPEFINLEPHIGGLDGAIDALREKEVK